VQSVAGSSTRIDIDRDGNGCHSVWTSKESVPNAVSQLSLANGLVPYAGGRVKSILPVSQSGEGPAPSRDGE